MTSSEASSAQCASSTISTAGRRGKAIAPSSASMKASRSSPSPASAPPASRAMSRNGPSGRGVNRSSQVPTSTCAFATCAANARGGQVWPMPASPESSTVVPRPCRASSRAACRSRSWASRSSSLIAGDRLTRRSASLEAHRRTDEFPGGGAFHLRQAGDERNKEPGMSKVYTGASMSLDGYISGPDETGFDHLFKWYGNGDVEVRTTHPELPARMTTVSAEYFRNIIDSAGALVVGRRLFDITDGWGGNHPIGCPVVVLTHSVPDGWPREDAPFTFVTEGIEQAVERARELAGDKAVGVNGGTIAQQCLDAGLLDEVWIDLVPV